ncbi:hypothetical protein L6452_05574 [Arctium lappa]|uniref:Uncharacterized protein n=1 Tax=Arctium lappa TaxID=4217 RepID=A0ACB9EGT4_ARCLA|nr:hypothetical protein L6452_05574 [Arctium lappa]
MVHRQREDEDAPPENNDIFVNEAPHHNPVNVVEVIVNHPEDPMREPEDRLPKQQASQEGRTVTKWELCRLVKELRKYDRYKLALQVDGWMKKKPERFVMALSDASIQLDLVSKVEGISVAVIAFLNH